MVKPKTGVKQNKGGFIDMREINETMDKNEDVIANLIQHYRSSMVKVGDRNRESNTFKLAQQLVESHKRGQLSSSNFVFDRDVFSVIMAKAK